MNQILQSFLAVLGVSIIITTLLHIIGYNAPTVFIIITLLQIFFFYFYNNILKYIAKLKLKKSEYEIIKLMNDNNIFIECGACKTINNTPINLSNENVFECKNCKTINKIEITYSTIVQTKIYE